MSIICDFSCPLQTGLGTFKVWWEPTINVEIPHSKRYTGINSPWVNHPLGNTLSPPFQPLPTPLWHPLSWGSSAVLSWPPCPKLIQNVPCTITLTLVMNGKVHGGRSSELVDEDTGHRVAFPFVGTWQQQSLYILTIPCTYKQLQKVEEGWEAGECSEGLMAMCLWLKEILLTHSFI